MKYFGVDIEPKMLAAPDTLHHPIAGNQVDEELVDPFRVGIGSTGAARDKYAAKKEGVESYTVPEILYNIVCDKQQV